MIRRRNRFRSTENLTRSSCFDLDEISPYFTIYNYIYINFNFPYHSCQSCNNHVRNKSLSSSKKFHLYFEISNRNEPDDVPVKKKKKKRLSNSLVTSFTEAARARVYTYRRNCIYPESYLRWAKSHWGILRAGSDLGIACAPTFSSSSNLSPPTAEPARIQAGRMQMHRWHFYARTVYTVSR